MSPRPRRLGSQPARAVLAAVLLCCAAVLQVCGDSVRPTPQSEEPRAKLVLLSDFPKARCLDGSPGAYYFREASDEKSSTSWVIFLQGGGSCIEDATCTERRSTELGSSNAYRETEDLRQLVSSNATDNPALAKWNHVWIRYCSGDLHLGMVHHSDELRWGWARFAGHEIVKGVLADLIQSKGLEDATRVVWTGDSAGGIGSFAHVDYVADRLPKASVVGAPIGGYYWNDATRYTGPGRLHETIPFDADSFKAYHKLWKTFLPRRCSEGPHEDDPWVCALADYSFPTVVSPVFIIEAQVDYKQTTLHAGSQCDPRMPDYPPQAEYCLHWGRNMSKHLQKVADRAKEHPRQAGLFSPACRMHVTFSNQEPKVGGASYAEALAAWMSGEDPAVVKRDDCCSGTSIVLNPTCPWVEPEIPHALFV